MSGEMPEQIAAQITRNTDKGRAGNPTGNPPQQIIRGNQAREQREAEPSVADAVVGVQSCRQRIHQNLDTVLRAH